jgi:hypothetical protein
MVTPPEIPAALGARLLNQLSSKERRRFTAAYRLDENAVPPVYALLRTEGQAQAADERCASYWRGQRKRQVSPR